MPQANVHRITSAKMAKLCKLDTLDAINARLRYAKAAVRLAEAQATLASNEEYEADLTEGQFGDPEVRAIVSRMLDEVDDLVDHLATFGLSVVQ